MSDRHNDPVIQTSAPFAHRAGAKLVKNTKGYGFEISVGVVDNGQPLENTLVELARTIDRTMDITRESIKRAERLDAGYPVGPPIAGVDGQTEAPPIPPPDNLPEPKEPGVDEVPF